jgi:hypothetical protein
MRIATRRQRGQALTEFLVVAVAVIPLFLLIPVIAKYQDISNATQMASRYLAFDAITRNDSVSTWKPENELGAEVSRRFFSNPDAPIKTDDAPGNFKAHQNLFWRGPRDEPLISDFGTDVRVSFGSNNGTTHADAFSTTSDGEPPKGPFLRHSALDLRARGIYTVNVAVRLANLPSGLKFYEPFDTIDLSIARGTSVMVDAWTAQNPGDIETRIAGNPVIFPAAKLASISPAVDAAVRVIDAPGGIVGPKLGKLDFWRDVVPDDRLRSSK